MFSASILYSSPVYNLYFLGMPQRQDSFNDHGLYMQSSPAGPLGLVQPPAISSPLGNTSGLGLGMLSFMWS